MKTGFMDHAMLYHGIMRGYTLLAGRRWGMEVAGDVETWRYRQPTCDRWGTRGTLGPK